MPRTDGARARRKVASGRREPWTGPLLLRLVTGLSVVAAAGLLAGFGPVETRAGQLLQLDAGPPSAAAPPAGTSSGYEAAKPAAAAGTDLVTSTDRDLLVRVRLAGLWEIPAGRMAATKGVDPQVRRIGAEIAEQHVKLNEQVVAAAARVNVVLPDEPNADQRFWLDEMARAQGRAFDQVFVDRLREAHGKVFPLVSAVRVGTRNPVVRGLASSANGFVLNHLTLLESTRLVDWRVMGGPPAVISVGPPALSDYRPVRPAPGDPPRMLAAWAVLGLAALTGTVGLARLLAPRLFGHPARLPGLAAPPGVARAMDGLSGY